MLDDLKGFQTRRLGFKANTRAEGDSAPPAGFIAGYASTEELDCYNTILQAGCFAKAIRERGLKGPRGVKLIDNHRRDRVAGLITTLEQRGTRLYIEAQLNLNISYARDLYEAAKMVDGLSFSVGFDPIKYTYDEPSGVITFIECDLPEISVVTFPGNPGAEMTDVRNAPEDVSTIAAFERLLVTKGLVEGRNAARRLTQEVKRHAALFLKAAGAPEATPPITTPPVSADDQSLAAVLEDLRNTRAALEARTGKSN